MPPVPCSLVCANGLHIVALPESTIDVWHPFRRESLNFLRLTTRQWPNGYHAPTTVAALSSLGRVEAPCRRPLLAPVCESKVAICSAD